MSIRKRGCLPLKTITCRLWWLTYTFVGRRLFYAHSTQNLAKRDGFASWWDQQTSSAFTACRKIINQSAVHMEVDVWYMRVSNLFVIWGWPTVLDAPRKSPSNQPANHPSIGWYAWCQGLTRQRHNAQAMWKYSAWAWMERWLEVMSTRNCWKVWVNFIVSWRSHVWLKFAFRGSVDCSAILVVRSWTIHTWSIHTSVPRCFLLCHCWFSVCLFPCGISTPMHWKWLSARTAMNIQAVPKKLQVLVGWVFGRKPPIPACLVTLRLQADASSSTRWQAVASSFSLKKKSGFMSKHQECLTVQSKCL